MNNLTLRLTLHIQAILLALALTAPAAASYEPSRNTLRDLTVQESDPKRAGLEEALGPLAASGLEELQLEPEQRGALVEVLQRVRLEKLLTPWDLYQPDLKHRPEFRLLLDAKALAVQWPEGVPVAAQQLLAERLQNEVFGFLPSEIQLDPKFRNAFESVAAPLDPGEEERRNQELVKAIREHLPYVDLHDAINSVLQAVDPTPRVNLAMEQAHAQPIVGVHTVVYQRIMVERRRELFDYQRGRLSYTMTEPGRAIRRIQFLRELGYLDPGKRFADLGCANGLWVDLVAEMSDADATGFELDKGLLQEAMDAGPALIEKGMARDESRVHWQNRNYLDPEADLARFDVLFIYPPWIKVQGNWTWGVHPLAVVERMKPGAILIVEGTMLDSKLESSPLVQKVPGVGGWLRVEPPATGSPAGLEEEEVEGYGSYERALAARINQQGDFEVVLDEVSGEVTDIRSKGRDIWDQRVFVLGEGRSAGMRLLAYRSSAEGEPQLLLVEPVFGKFELVSEGRPVVRVEAKIGGITSRVRRDLRALLTSVVQAGGVSSFELQSSHNLPPFHPVFGEGVTLEDGPPFEIAPEEYLELPGVAQIVPKGEKGLFRVVVARPSRWIMSRMDPAAGLEEMVAERLDGLRSAAPELRTVVIGRSVADKFQALRTLAGLEERFLVDEGADTVVRLAEWDVSSVAYYGGLEEAGAFASLAEQAFIAVEPHSPSAPTFLAQLREILILAGIPQDVLAAGLEEFAAELESLAVGA